MMLTNELKSYYLEAMGIVQWQDRELNFLKKTIYVYEAYCNEQLTTLFLFEKKDDVNEIKLLNQIAKALNFSIKQQAPILFQEYKMKFQVPNVVIFDKKICDYLPENLKVNKIITTHALPELINHPQLKKETWKDLQMLLA